MIASNLGYFESMRQLSDLIRDWEMRNGFSVDTMKRAKAGEPIKKVSAYQIAKTLGCSDEDAKGLADKASPSVTQTAKRRTA